MHEHNNGISRRDLFKFGGIAAAGVVGAGALASCAPQGTGSAGSASTTSTTDETTTAAGHLRTGMPSFLTAPEAITDVKETKDYDVVVIGAGASGVPAALSAFEAGAKVALLQKDAEIMREEEVEQLSRHFRSKIAEARRQAEQGDSALSFHAVMRDILDYRKWFEFRLEYQKTGEVKKGTDRPGVLYLQWRRKSHVDVCAAVFSRSGKV